MRREYTPTGLQEVTEASIEREMRSIEAAIDLVAAGQASRVSLGGLRLAEMLVGEARRMAAPLGVRIQEVWPLGDGSPDLVIEVAGRAEVDIPDA